MKVRLVDVTEENYSCSSLASFSPRQVKSLGIPTNMNLDYNWVQNETKIYHKIETVFSKPFKTQFPESNYPLEGLLAPAEEFMQTNYVENFVQSVINVLKPESIIIGGLGNLTSNKFLLQMVRIAAGNKVTTTYIGIQGVISRPMISHLAKKYNCWGLLIHNSCYRIANYNAKYLAIDLISPNGGPINPDILDNVFDETQNITEFRIVPSLCFSFGFSSCKLFTLSSGELSLFVIDTVSEYTNIIRDIFDFEDISSLLTGRHFLRPFRISINCNNGCMGRYARRIFEKELGAGAGSVILYEPSEDVNALHPATIDKLHNDGEMKLSTNDFVASIDGVGARAVIYGQNGFLVNPGESLAILTKYYKAIPYFLVRKFTGVGRTFYTTSSVDDVARKRFLNLVKAPGSWLYFNSPMESGDIVLCEDEYFGIGSAHVPTSDAIWSILAWLSLVTYLYKPVRNILCDYWTQYGRNFLTTYEFHHIPYRTIDKIIHDLHYKTMKSDEFSMSSNLADAGPIRYDFKTDITTTYDDCPLIIGVKPNGRLIFKTIALNKVAILKIIVEVYSKINNPAIDKTSVTDNLFRLAMELSQVGVVAGKNIPDAVY